jgi:hypothetical protein
MTGIDSKFGAIIHELSHFDIIAGATDYFRAYPPSGVRSLAQIDPVRAITNANNYEYFAENTPGLPMEIKPLTLNQAVTEQIPESTWLYYKVTGASRIILSDMDKDFDLYVKAGQPPTRSDYNCRHLFSFTTSETCEISNSGAVFIAIRSYLRSERLENWWRPIYIVGRRRY